MSSIGLDSASPATAAASPALAARGTGCLVQIRPLDVHGGLIHVPDNGFLIGRDDLCDHVVRDASVSRRHANIERCQGGYVVTDLGSTNGTFVNERRISSQPLRAGDRLRTASHIFKFLSSDHIEAQYHETVYSMMTKDGLTGAYNQRYFLEVLEREIERARRHQRPLSLVLFDIDHFKSVNDQHGHLAGDEVLQELSRRVEAVVRRDEVFARYGGEEFVMVMAETGLDGAVPMAERIRAAIADRPFHTAQVSLNVTVSVGVAVLETVTSVNGIEDVEMQRSNLIAAADAKLYEGKLSGRNRVCS